RKIDYAGTALLVLGLLPMLLAFTWAGKDYSWLSPQIIGMLTFSALMLILFGFVEKKAAEPILPMSLFKNNTFKVSAAAAFLSNAAMFGAVLFIPLFVQIVIGANATNSGMVTTPMMIGFTIASILSGQAISRFKNLRIFGVAGFILTGIGIYMLTRLTVASTRSEVVIDMVIAGLGIGLNMPVFNLAVQNAFPQSQLGVVTSGVQFFRNIGGTIASAVFGSVMLSSMKTGLKSIDLGTLTTGGTSSFHSILKDPQSLTNPGTIAGIRAHIPQSAIPEFNKFLIHLKSILSNAIHDVFIVCLLIAVIAILTALFLPNTPLIKKQDSQSV
ncbi:MAG TPA: MFS transporter, partial [Clostridia bacterium]|nr:MFS transporter [Clostridia bacterium]